MAGFATKQDLADFTAKQNLANLAMNKAVAKCATKEDLAGLEQRVNVVAEDVAVLKSDVRTLKWIVAGVGFGMLTVLLGVSSLMLKIFQTV